MAHARLSIQDISPMGHQPMLSEDGEVALVFNGEIYNFRELRPELAAAGYRFRGHSDTEVLLAGYLRDGDAIISKLNGVFAFAVWDRRCSRLLLARDAFGVKPLYFHAGADGFAFASEIKALLPLLRDAGGLDPVAIHRYLSFLWCPGDGTPLRNVRKLGPGECLEVRNGNVTRHWRWYRPPTLAPPAPRPMGRAEAVRETEGTLRRATQRQLVSDVPVGAFLSGGLDSSAIVAFASERIPDLRCFTIDAAGPDVEGATGDLPYARRVAAHLGVPLEIVTVDAARMAAEVEGLVYQLDEPLADPAVLNVKFISEIARSQGIKVLLSGAGGDDLFSGYRRHLALAGEPYWSWLPVSVRKSLRDVASRLDHRIPMFRRLAKLFSGAALSDDERIANYFVWTGEDRLRGLYTHDFREAVGAEWAVEPLLAYLSEAAGSLSRLQRMLALEQRFFLTDHNLCYTDKMSMTAGVEVRVPFLDPELVDLAARIPDRFKQRGREGKWVLKKAMEPYLPHDVIYRPKSGFGAPLRAWIRGDLREMIRDVLSSESLRRRGIFEPAAVDRLIEDNLQGHVDASYTLFSLCCIELWCRRFADYRTVGTADRATMGSVP